MTVRNSPYYVINRNTRTVPRLHCKHSPSVFDYISKNLGLVNGLLDNKSSTISIENGKTDVVVISDQTLTKLRNEYIEVSLESGEPMDGITYDEFVQYYQDKQGFCWNDNYMHKLYSQAQKGWKASCAEREWRTNPDFIMTNHIFSSPELTEDREIAFEKFKNGYELSKLENELLSTFPNAKEGSERIYAVMQERGKIAFKQNLLNNMRASGVELSPDDEIKFTVWGYDLIDVQGTVGESDLNAIKETMSECAYSLDKMYSAKHNRETMSDNTRFQFDQFKKAQHYLNLAGGGSLLDITKDDNGDYHGIPDKLETFLKDNKRYRGDDKAGMEAMWVRNAFDETISAIKAGRYDWFMSKISTVTFKNGEFYV